MRASQLRWVLAVAILCLAAGCVKEKTVGNTTTVTKEWYSTVLIALGGLGAAAGGWYLTRSQSDKVRLNGWAILIVGPLFALGMAPSEFTEFVRVTPERFEANIGFWMWPDKFNVAFSQIASVRDDEKIRRGKYGREIHDAYIVFTMRDRKEVWVPANLTVQKALPKIAEYYAAALAKANPPAQPSKPAPTTTASSKPASVKPAAPATTTASPQTASATASPPPQKPEIVGTSLGPKPPPAADSRPTRPRPSTSSMATTQDLSSGQPVTASTPLALGTRVNGLHRGKWESGRVIETPRGSLIRIAWDSGGVDTVPRGMLRLPSK